ncbi:efflux RND transporter periplasmic adaptor subunit [Naumannella halotolerans]|uniref:HlyD family secretion protein n=1 Tax=Naumannella halotolerans TaxID=993414 RepID=A0A4R7J938_9ACTN|nr:hypothetical protein [Naumannella halotolerans]TDT34021.1 hypothetical protein CLV29_1665 [Naumannella halotolerans]
MDNATLTADIDGIVTEVGYEVGDVVGTGTGQTSGSTDTSTEQAAAGGTGTGTSTSTSTSTESTAESAAISLVSDGTFVVDATVSADEVDQVTDGMQVELTATDLTEPVFGTVSEVAVLPEVDDAGSAGFPVTIEITGQRDDLYAGVSVDVSIMVSQRTDVLAVSIAAIQTGEDDATYVDLVTVTDEDGAVTATERVPVEIGEVSGMSTEIVSGLADGDVVEVPGITLPTGSGQQGGAGGMPGGGQGMPGGGQGMPGGGQGMPGGSGQMPGGGAVPNMDGGQ